MFIFGSFFLYVFWMNKGPFEDKKPEAQKVIASQWQWWDVHPGGPAPELSPEPPQFLSGGAF